jgi:hypothetical protein
MGHTEFLGKISEGHGTYQTVGRPLERLAHVYANVDRLGAVYYTVNDGAQVEAGWLRSEEHTASLHMNDSRAVQTVE